MHLPEEECALCNEVFRYYFLRRCTRCKKMYCRNCTIYSEEGQILCLGCAKRTVTPKTARGKYAHLSIYLSRRAKYSPNVTLSFDRLQEIIGDNLPSSAYSNKEWWSNVRNRTPSEYWMTTGWRVEKVDLEKKEVTLRKDKVDSHSEGKPKKQRRRKNKAAFRALATKRKTVRPRLPSKTKIAKALARLKNVERARLQTIYRGKLKPKKAYEKRLYKEGEKP